MTNGWYKIVDPDVPITQGDIIFDCPLVTWRGDLLLNFEGKHESEVLKVATLATIADVIVLTQACDLQYSKVANVILCPHLILEDYRTAWEKEMRRNEQNPTPKAWKSHCDDICDGLVWNLAMINSAQINSSKIDIRVVDFRDVFSIPRTFLESLLQKRNSPRFSLLPPYREHLSQAFARFFMRVGLPIEISQTW